MAPTAVPLTVEGAVSTLETLGILPVIALGALIWIAGMAYRRFRR